MAFEHTGTIKEIFDIQTFPSGFTKREFVITTDERFPQEIKFDCLKEKVDLLKQFKKGDIVRVNFDIRGREYKGRYFVDLSAWKIGFMKDESSSTDDPTDYSDVDFIPEDNTDYGGERDEDIPF
ncbi:MAG: hypothetical protein DF168_01172 [Candidatus Moanabacter tarae]|uniref:DUF3127 domain-containing protein n=1 Tax=Candidatus Moanibacter tarae TaxID=2200854 RepID=A0A2Z4ACT8_9BACT|nr:MAG: hypothetical protein DF168_01172 [Candidatus Moanabacter tarae]|tara:strand:+ start:2408 stop:2779 length:372 start_codon:yes stop_codon:yes gene_type:complete